LPARRHLFARWPILRLFAAGGTLCREKQRSARGTGLRRVRSGAEVGVDERFRSARRGLDFQTVTGGYSYGELVTARFCKSATGIILYKFM
jgi:hypothetical protein